MKINPFDLQERAVFKWMAVGKKLVRSRKEAFAPYSLPDWRQFRSAIVLPRLHSKYEIRDTYQELNGEKHDILRCCNILTRLLLDFPGRMDYVLMKNIVRIGQKMDG